MAVFGYGLNEKATKTAVDKLRGIVADAEKDFALELHRPATRCGVRASAACPASPWCSPIRRTIPGPAATGIPLDCCGL